MATTLYVPAMGATFGRWLKTRRVSLGLSQGDIAQQLQIGANTVSNWENDVTIPKLNLEQSYLLSVLLKTNNETLAKAFKGEIEIDV